MEKSNNSKLTKTDEIKKTKNIVQVYAQQIVQKLGNLALRTLNLT
jgi:hypothetical protein